MVLIYLPDILSSIVDRIAEEQPVYFMFGNWQELCNDLTEKGQIKSLEDKKYPLILLHNDYSEVITGKIVEVNGLKVYIIAQSEKEYSTQDRFEKTYANVLNPLYKFLMKRLKMDTSVIKDVTNIKHERKDLYYLYVGDKINRLPDFLDAIELQFPDFKYKLKKC